MTKYSKGYDCNHKNPNEIILSRFMKKLLLLEICRRMNIIDFCSYSLGLKFKNAGENVYTGKCPWRGENTFKINKTSGLCFCSACCRNEDLFSLVSYKKKFSLNKTLHYLTRYIAALEEHSGNEYPEGGIL